MGALMTKSGRCIGGNDEERWDKEPAGLLLIACRQFHLRVTHSACARRTRPTDCSGYRAFMC